MVWGVGVSVVVGRDNPATTSLATAPVLPAVREANVISVSHGRRLYVYVVNS